MLVQHLDLAVGLAKSQIAQFKVTRLGVAPPGLIGATMVAPGELGRVGLDEGLCGPVVGRAITPEKRGLAFVVALDMEKIALGVAAHHHVGGAKLQHVGLEGGTAHVDDVPERRGQVDQQFPDEAVAEDQQAAFGDGAGVVHDAQVVGVAGQGRPVVEEQRRNERANAQFLNGRLQSQHACQVARKRFRRLREVFLRVVGNAQLLQQVARDRKPTEVGHVGVQDPEDAGLGLELQQQFPGIDQVVRQFGLQRGRVAAQEQALQLLAPRRRDQFRHHDGLGRKHHVQVRNAPGIAVALATGQVVEEVRHVASLGHTLPGEEGKLALTAVKQEQVVLQTHQHVVANLAWQVFVHLLVNPDKSAPVPPRAVSLMPWLPAGWPPWWPPSARASVWNRRRFSRGWCSRGKGAPPCRRRG
jgi:hypothetical protein